MLLFIICVQINSVWVNSFYLPSKGFIANDTAEEIQHAICKITSKELQATANATITRQLKGVCTSAYIQEKFLELQTEVLRQIDGIKTILESNGFIIPESKTEGSDNSGTFFMEKSLEHEGHGRIDEIFMYNDTVADSDEGSMYYYYWDIHQVKQLLKKKEMYKSSPEFFALGHMLHLQFYPNHLEKKHFGILLRPSSNGFLKKHRIIILNQLHKNLDITSSVLNGIRSDDSLFLVSEDLINKEGFIHDDIIIVKLELFLNS